MNTIAVPTIFKISVIEEEGPNFDLQCQYVAILCYRKFNTTNGITYYVPHNR